MLTATEKLLLNKFADTQPGLNDRDLPRSQAGLKLGDLLDDPIANLRVTKAVVYDVAVDGGTISAKTLDLTLPAGAIPVSFITQEVVALASGGLATVALAVGAQALKVATAFDDATYQDIDKTEISSLAALASTSSVTVTVAGAALTAGRIRIIVEYIKG